MSLVAKFWATLTHRASAAHPLNGIAVYRQYCIGDESVLVYAHDKCDALLQSFGMIDPANLQTVIWGAICEQLDQLNSRETSAFERSNFGIPQSWTARKRICDLRLEIAFLNEKIDAETRCSVLEDLYAQRSKAEYSLVSHGATILDMNKVVDRFLDEIRIAPIASDNVASWDTISVEVAPQKKTLDEEFDSVLKGLEKIQMEY